MFLRNVLVKSLQFKCPGHPPAVHSSYARNISGIFNFNNFGNGHEHEGDGGCRGNGGNGRDRREHRKGKPPPNNGNNEFVKLVTGGGVSLGILGFFEKKEEELSIEDTILLYIKKAILSVQRGDIELAEQNLVNALRLSHEHNLEDAKTQIFDMQANLAFQKQEFDRAETLFKTTAQRLVHHQNYATNDNAIVEISLKLAQIYASRGKKDEAVSGYEYCIKTQRDKIEKEGGAEDEDTLLLAAWAMHSLAQLQLTFGAQGYIDKTKIEQTAILIKDAYKYAAKAVGPDSEQAISIQSDLASTLAMTGDFDGALTKLREVEKIAREKHKSLYPHIRVNIGNVYLQKGSYLEAEQVCVDARMFARNVKNMEAFARAEECLLASTKARQSAQA